MFNINKVSTKVIDAVKASNDYMTWYNQVKSKNLELDYESPLIFKKSIDEIPSFKSMNNNELLYIWKMIDNYVVGFDLIRFCRLNKPKLHKIITDECDQIRSEVSKTDQFKEVFPNFGG